MHVLVKDLGHQPEARIARRLRPTNRWELVLENGQRFRRAGRGRYAELPLEQLRANLAQILDAQKGGLYAFFSTDDRPLSADDLVQLAGMEPEVVIESTSVASTLTLPSSPESNASTSAEGTGAPQPTAEVPTPEAPAAELETASPMGDTPPELPTPVVPPSATASPYEEEEPEAAKPKPPAPSIKTNKRGRK